MLGTEHDGKDKKDKSNSHQKCEWRLSRCFVDPLVFEVALQQVADALAVLHKGVDNWEQ